jgi:hypothetical protein
MSKDVQVCALYACKRLSSFQVKFLLYFLS